MGLLVPVRVNDWRKGRIDFLERVIQGNLHKISSSMAIFRHWAMEKGLEPCETGYVRHTRAGLWPCNSPRAAMRRSRRATARTMFLLLSVSRSGKSFRRSSNGLRSRSYSRYCATANARNAARRLRKELSFQRKRRRRCACPVRTWTTSNFFLAQKSRLRRASPVASAPDCYRLCLRRALGAGLFSGSLLGRFFFRCDDRDLSLCCGYCSFLGRDCAFCSGLCGSDFKRGCLVRFGFRRCGIRFLSCCCLCLRYRPRRYCGIQSLL